MKKIVYTITFLLSVFLTNAQIEEIDNYIQNSNCAVKHINSQDSVIRIPTIVPTIKSTAPSPVPLPLSPDRLVFWVHGYQGNEHSFIRVANEVEGKFKVQSRSPDYNASQSSLASSASNLEIDINDYTYYQPVNQTEKNFIIAHSMGGLVSRTMGELQNTAGNPRYNGIITFGTPHLGTFAANTLVDNEQVLQDVVQDACNSLGAGPFLEDISHTGAMGSLAINFGFAGGILNQACNAGVAFGFANILPYFMEGLEDELTTSAAASIPNMPTEHKAAFYGIENGNNDGSLTPRYIGSLLEGPNNFPLYGADASDQVGINAVASELDFYTTQMNYWDGVLCNGIPVYIYIGGIPIYIGCIGNTADEIADAYEDGVDWINDLDPTWKELIGVTQTSIVPSGECICYVWNSEAGKFLPVCAAPCNDFDCGPCDYVEEPNMIVVTQVESDGFILTESAMNAPGANYLPQLMLGSNHMQMRNDSEMEEAIKKIFEQGFGNFVNDYFYTEFR